MYNTGHAFTHLLLKESVANDVINVSLFGPMLADFQNSFTVVFPKQFSTKLMPRCPPHLRCVAALPGET